MPVQREPVKGGSIICQQKRYIYPPIAGIGGGGRSSMPLELLSKVVQSEVACLPTVDPGNRPLAFYRLGDLRQHFQVGVPGCCCKHRARQSGHWTQTIQRPQKRFQRQRTRSLQTPRRGFRLQRMSAQQGSTEDRSESQRWSRTLHYHSLGGFMLPHFTSQHCTIEELSRGDEKGVTQAQS